MEKNTAKLLVAGLKRLLRERKQMDDAINSLQAVLGKHGTGTGNGRAPMSDDARHRISEMMKKRWEKRRKKKDKAVAPKAGAGAKRTAPRVAGRKTPIYPSAVLGMTKKYSVPEISAKLDLNEYTVRALIRKAKANLRKPEKAATEAAAT